MLALRSGRNGGTAMKNLIVNLASCVLLVTLLAVLGIAGCANEGAPGEDDTSLGGYGGGDAENCVPCEPGTEALGTDKWGNLCCGLTVGTGTYDPCHGACGPATVCDKDADPAVCVPLGCDDGVACTTDSGDQVAGCVHTANNAACDDKNACTADTCDAKTGCVFTNNTAACDDNNPCTTNDACGGGACVGGDAAVCNDNNVCTTNSCDPLVAGGCVYANNSAACDDGNFCTSGDTCAAGVCGGGAAVVCDDGNACTADTCVKQVGCVYAPIVPCNLPPCDDGKLCTDDSGIPGACVYVNNAVACNDNNPCTSNDVCGAGVCAGTGGPNCDDNNPCTDDTCNLVTGCAHTNNVAVCSDNNACTTGDVCGAGVCVAGAATVCSDNNGCTQDSCVAATGCVYTPVPDCQDGAEICGDCLDNDGDGAIDCADAADCGGDALGYTLYIYSPGGSISVLPNGWATAVDFALPGAGQQLSLDFLCSELPFAVAVNGGANGPTQVWVQSVIPGGQVPDLWEFAVYVPWVGAPVLNPVGDALISKDFSVPGDGNFLVLYPAQ